MQSNKSQQKPPQKSPHKPQHKPRAPLAHQVRIIGGLWKRTPLPVLAAEGLRPTPDRVRETVFNWLAHLLTGSQADGNWGQVACLDLFAGSGALGFEAASRGAGQVLMVEAHTPAVRQLEATKAKLNAAHVEVLRADALAAAQKLVAAGRRYDLIFLDPPYHQQWLPKILPLCAVLLQEGGLLYLEAEESLENGAWSEDPAASAWLAGWQVIRADHAGSVFYHLLQRKNTP